ncbi:hypothetical protein GJ633_03000 [Halorubrum sp. CBA1125]|uniref:hypothetical protein n=1 Tax=Halorubrum sp. CBA1125 TaxID=2668072 RepID=UPI0012E81542|nr:hypothetical protein [Halorubrum sp. CBA1125]MUW13739.1 hypothetical protein [Halorubrum sp. CBA1125]
MDKESDSDKLEVTRDESEIIFTSQVEMYQHLQRISTNLLNIFIGALTLVLTAFGTGYLEIPQFSAADVQEIDTVLAISDGYLILVKSSGVLVFGIGLVIIFLLLISTLMLLFSLLWPENLEPLLGSTGEKLSIVDQKSNSNFEEYTENNMSILEDMTKRQSESYKSLVLAALFGIFSIYFGGVMIEGNYDTLFFIYAALCSMPIIYVYYQSSFTIHGSVHQTFDWVKRNYRDLQWFGTRVFLISSIMGMVIKISQLKYMMSDSEIKDRIHRVVNWYRSLPIHPLVRQYVVVIAGIGYITMISVIFLLIVEYIRL